jgi:hypothetical protein
VLTGADARQLISALKGRFANLRDRPDAIFAVHGDASVSAYEFLLDSSYKIPQEVALMFGIAEHPVRNCASSELDSKPVFDAKHCGDFCG